MVFVAGVRRVEFGSNAVTVGCTYVVRLYVSVTLVHPAKAVGRNGMPFDRDTCVVPSNTVLERGPGPPREGKIWGSEPPVHSDAANRQITFAFVLYHRSHKLIYSHRVLPRLTVTVCSAA